MMGQRGGVVAGVEAASPDKVVRFQPFGQERR